MLQLLIDPLHYEFIRNALAISVIIGILCPVVGSYLIVQRMALLGDVMAHCVLPGLSLSFFLGIDMMFGAFASGMLGSFLIAWIRSQSRVKVDAAMALTFSSFFALGIILITVLKNKLDLDSFLFGDILSVTSHDIIRTLIIAVMILVAVKAFYKELLFFTFDRTGAQALGLPVNLLHLAFMAAITLTIIASMQVVGVILVIALLIGPALTAYLLTTELHQMMGVGVLFGILSSLAGVYISYYNNLPSGPAIVLVSSSLFLLALFFSPSQGILTRPSSSGTPH
ncbi:metal ABC transporter permease [Alkalinema pantanalense CENA528]|uniref:metal ABC transporter permease n=1 Tax=Alkalinema pantanalense TaxID=1620705 RepID=UPI003D6F80E1